MICGVWQRRALQGVGFKVLHVSVHRPATVQARLSPGDIAGSRCLRVHIGSMGRHGGITSVSHVHRGFAKPADT